MTIRTKKCLAILGAIWTAGVAVHAGAHADELYTAETIVNYLGEKEHVFIGVRLDGGISLGDIVGMQREIGAEQFADETLEELGLQNEIAYPRHRVLVLRNLRGELPVTIDLSPDRDVADTNSMPLGEPILVFANRESGELAFAICEIMPLELLPTELVQTADVEGIVRYIRDHRLYCLRERIIETPVSD